MEWPKLSNWILGQNSDRTVIKILHPYVPTSVCSDIRMFRQPCSETPSYGNFLTITLTLQKSVYEVIKSFSDHVMSV